MDLRKPWGWDFGVEGEWQEPQDERRGAVRPQYPPRPPGEDGRELCVAPLSQAQARSRWGGSWDGRRAVAARADGLGLWLVPCLGEMRGLFPFTLWRGPLSYSPNPQDTLSPGRQCSTSLGNPKCDGRETASAWSDEGVKAPAPIPRRALILAAAAQPLPSVGPQSDVGG